MHDNAPTPDAGLAIEQVQPVAGPADASADLDNWQEPTHLRWAFQHMDEVMPSQVIAAGSGAPRPLPKDPHPIGAVELVRFDGSTGTLDEVLADTHTDAFLVLHEGRVVHERYHGAMTASTRHLVMSVSKSIVGCVAAGLVEAGALDPDAQVTRYVPEVAGSGYDGATVRNVLDMRTGVAFRETYTDPDAEVRVMERSMGWAPRNHGDPLGMYPYILSIEPATAHDGPFTYRSIDTDVLGWVCERAAGARMADLVSARVWQPIGAFHDAEVTADSLGAAIHDGGISTTLRDLGRFGLMLAADGTVEGRQVVPAEWIRTACYPPADVREAFAASDNEPYMPGGWYRNQFWFIPGDNGPILLCLGIHGQMVFVEQSTGLVVVKLSSWPLPQDSIKLLATIAAFRQLGRVLA